MRRLVASLAAAGALAAVVVAPAAQADPTFAFWTLTGRPGLSASFTVSRPTVLRDSAHYGRYFPQVTATSASYAGYVIQRASDDTVLDGAVWDTRMTVPDIGMRIWWDLGETPDRIVLVPHQQYVVTYLSDRPGTISFEVHNTSPRTFHATKALRRVSYQQLTQAPAPVAQTVAVVPNLSVGASTFGMVASFQDYSGAEALATYADQCLVPQPGICQTQPTDVSSVVVYDGTPGVTSWLGSANFYWPGHFDGTQEADAVATWASAAASVRQSGFVLTVT
jgi:hypothetical protein